MSCPNCGYCPHCGRSARPSWPTTPTPDFDHLWRPWTSPWCGTIGGYTDNTTSGARIPTHFSAEQNLMGGHSNG